MYLTSYIVAAGLCNSRNSMRTMMRSMKRVEKHQAWRVMKWVMKRHHHSSIASAPISIEMKVSSPPRLLPQAEGNFRQQHLEAVDCWRLRWTLRFGRFNRGTNKLPSACSSTCEPLPNVGLPQARYRLGRGGEWKHNQIKKRVLPIKVTLLMRSEIYICLA